MKNILSDYFPIRLLDKYLFSEFFKTFLGTLVMISGILLVSQITGNQKNFIASKEPNYHIYLFLLFKLPKIIIFAIPLSLMFSVCFVVGQFSSNKELVSSMAAGISFYRTVSPIIFFSGFMWVFMFLGNEIVVRPLNSLAAYEYSRIMSGIGTKTDMVYQLHIKGKEGFYYVYWLDAPNKTVKGGFSYIKINSENFPEYVISAQSAKYEPSNHTWNLKKIEEINFTKEMKIASHKNHDEKIYTFPEGSDYFLKPIKKAEEMNFFELNAEISIRKNKGVPTADLEVERHAIFAEPIMCLVVVLIGSLAGGLTKKSAGVASLGITIGVVLVYYVFYSTLRSIGENGAILPSISIWTTSLVFLFTSIILFKKINL